MTHTIYKLSCEDAVSFVLEATWGFAEVNPSGQYVWVNPAYCEILNAHADLVLDTSFTIWTHTEDLAIEQELFDKVSKGEIPGFTLAKRFIQRGSTPQSPRIVWGMLSVVGRWSTTKEFAGFRCQFQPYSIPNEMPSAFQWKKLISWTVENWKTIVTVLAVSTSLILGGSEKLLSTLKKAKDTADEVDQVLSSPSSLDGQSPQP